MRPPPERMLLFATPEHGCSYLPGRRAVTVFVDPHCPKTPEVYGRLAELGFRRSGSHVYRPRCPRCAACVPVRIPVAEFTPRRRHRRTLRRNRDLVAGTVAPAFRDEHFALYRRYLSSRHPGGGMDDPEPAQFMDFLSSSWSDTRFVEFRLDGALLAVAVCDRFPDGLSAVYTFFDPDATARSLGVYTVLWQIEHARALGLRWLYLGYYIEACQKMRYKSEYLPQEHLVGDRWTPVRSPAA